MPITLKEIIEPKQKYLQIIGKVHLGKKETSQKGNEYPTATPYFWISATDGITSERMERAVKERFGEEPTELPITFPADQEEVIWDCFMRAYNQSGLARKCTGEHAIVSDEGSLKEVPCLCRQEKRFMCKPVGTLQFLIRDLDLEPGAWSCTSSSKISISRITTTLRIVRGITGGRLRGVPFDLRLRPVTVHIPQIGRKVVYTLGLLCRATIGELRKLAKEPVTDEWLVALPQEPDPDLFPEATGNGNGEVEVVSLEGDEGKATIDALVGRLNDAKTIAELQGIAHEFELLSPNIGEGIQHLRQQYTLRLRALKTNGTASIASKASNV